MGLNRRGTEMASKKHRLEEAVAKLRQVDVLVSQGRSVAEAIRAIGVTEVTYYRWRRGVGGPEGGRGERRAGGGGRPAAAGALGGGGDPRDRRDGGALLPLAPGVRGPEGRPSEAPEGAG